MSSNDQDYQLYQYHPSKPGAIVFSILFFLATCFHVFRMARTHAWYFWVFILGGVFELVGYTGRAISAYDQNSLAPYIIQSLFILVAPTLFAASIYMTLNRIIAALNGESLSPIRRTLLTKIFVIGDAFSFCVQGTGGGMIAQAKGDHDKESAGRAIVIAGLVIQLLSFACFVITAAIFHYRVKRQGFSQDRPGLWPVQIIVLYIGSALIFVRILVRVIEFAQGNNGFIISHEVFLYTLDAVPMYWLMVVYGAWHPGVVSQIVKGRAKTSKGIEEAQS